jgi:DNA-binding NtrC family response regulator
MGGCQILLVDTDMESLHVGSKVLENMDYRVITANNGETAIEELKKGNFDLVNSDQTKVTKKAKEMSSKTMVILTLMANARLAHSDDVFRFEADEYLFKPFELTELGMRVASRIEKLELNRRDPQPESQGHTLHEKIPNMLKIASDEIRGSLVSMSATLKLLCRGYYGKMDEGVANNLEGLLSQTISLIGIAEEYLGPTFAVNDELKIEGKPWDLR